MATRREDIIIGLGGDSKQLLKDLNMSRQQVRAWAGQIAEEIKTGAIPESWKSYSRNASNALKQVESEGKTSVSSFGDHAGKMLAKVGTAFVAAFGVKKIIESLREVAKELDEFYKDLDAKRYKENQRQQQLGAMSRQDAELILAGDAQSSGLMNATQDQMGKAAGLFAFGAGAVQEQLKEFWRTKDPMRLLGFGLGDSFNKSNQRQADIIEGMRQAALQPDEKEAKKLLETEKKRTEELRKQRAELEAAKLQNFLVSASLESQHSTLMLNRDLSVRGTKEWYEWDTKVKEKEKEIFDQKQKAQEKEQRELEKIRKQQEKLAEKETERLQKFGERRFSFQRDLRSEFMPTLDELAAAGVYQRDARRLQFLAADTKRALQFGYRESYVEGNLGEIQSIRDRLTKAGVFRDPNQGVIDELHKLTQPIEKTGRLPVQVELDD